MCLQTGEWSLQYPCEEAQSLWKCQLCLKQCGSIFTQKTFIIFLHRWFFLGNCGRIRKVFLLFMTLSSLSFLACGTHVPSPLSTGNGYRSYQKRPPVPKGGGKRGGISQGFFAILRGELICLTERGNWPTQGKKRRKNWDQLGLSWVESRPDRQMYRLVTNCKKYFEN